MTAAVQTLSSSAIGRSSCHSLPSHSQRSTAGGGALVSITVRRDDPEKKAGVKLEQDANGRVRVKNIAKNGMFGDSELEIGDTILSVNRERLGGKNGPEVLLKAARKHHTITVSVRKGAPGGKGASVVDDDDNKPQKKDKKKWPSVKTTMNPTTKKKKTATKKQVGGMSQRNTDGSLTISAEKKKSSSSSSSVGLELEVRGEKLVVKGIEPKSIFAKTDLEVGDAVLSVNDMSFRRYPDAEYAARVMKKARVTVTLVVEKSGDGGDEGKGIGKKRSKRRSSSSSSTDSSTDSSSDSEHEYEFEIETEFKIEKYRPVTIIAPKMFSGENVGLQFKLVKTVTPMGKNDKKADKKKKSSSSSSPNASGGNDRIWVYVSEISDDSIFKDTPLREGDKIISINDVDMRGELSHADKRVALRECVKSTECVTMVVLKQDESTFLEQSFCLFDASTTNLDWMASATNLDYLKG